MAAMSAGATVEACLERSLAGDDAAWVHLLRLLWERVDLRVVTSRFMGQLRGSNDDRREVVSRVFARLRRNELRALRTFPAWRDAHPDKTFDDWLTILVTNVIRDYVAERLGDLDASGAGLKRLVNTLAESLDGADVPLRPSITNTVAAAQLIAVAKQRLPADQQSALGGWLAGADFAELAARHGWSTDLARKKVRAAIARLRRELGTEESS